MRTENTGPLGRAQETHTHKPGVTKRVIYDDQGTHWREKRLYIVATDQLHLSVSPYNERNLG